MICRTRGEDANHYATDAVNCMLDTEFIQMQNGYINEVLKIVPLKVTTSDVMMPKTVSIGNVCIGYVNFQDLHGHVMKTTLATS